MSSAWLSFGAPLALLWLCLPQNPPRFLSIQLGGCGAAIRCVTPLRSPLLADVCDLGRATIRCCGVAQLDSLCQCVCQTIFCYYLLLYSTRCHVPVPRSADVAHSRRSDQSRLLFRHPLVIAHAPPGGEHFTCPRLDCQVREKK
jgi:hypothetical protein